LAVTISAGLVLVVEDNPITRRMVRVTLQTEGYAVHEASDARAALAFMSRKTPDLIIQDLELPGVDGHQLLSQLKNNNANVPVLACTGYPDRATAPSAWADLLIKPVEPSQILRSVRTFLTQRSIPARVGGGRRILLVDDDPIQLKLSRIQLQQLGFEVATAGGGDEAIAYLRRGHVDAVVCDVLMPTTDGFKVCLAMRQDSHLADIPVVLVSAHYLDEMDRRFAERVGASAFVQRTPHAEEIATALTACMKNRWAPRPSLDGDELKTEHLHRAMLQLERQVAANANLTERTSLQAATLSVVGAISEALSSELDVNVALGRAVTHCLDAAGLSRGAIYLTAADGDLQPRTMVGRDGLKNDVGWRRFLEHPELFQRACDTNRPIAIPSPEVPRELAAEMLASLGGATSALLAPLTCLQGCLGLVLMVSDRSHLADSDWISFAEATGTLLAQSMVLGRSFRRLRDSELRYRALMDQATDAIVVTDSAGRILETNRRGETLFAAPRESLVGKPFAEMLAPTEQARHIQNFERLAVDGTFRADAMSYMRTDGKRVFVDISASKVQVGKDVCYYVNLRDVTVRVETEEQLVRARIDFRNVIELAPDGILIRRGDTVAYANPAFARSLGYDDPMELLGKHVPGMVAPAERPRSEARVLRGEGADRSDEFALVTKSGDSCHLEVSPAQMVEYEGAPASLVIARDVSERKKMQAQLMVSDRMASVGTLAAGVAHEINNPLATVLANVDLALRDVHEVGIRLGAKEDLIEELNDAREGVERVRQIARDLKVFSRGDEETRGPVDVHRAIESSLRMGWNEIRHRARLVKDFGTVPPVNANDSRLGQVFLNLVINAAQALPDSDANRNEIRIKTSTDSRGRVVIEVVDTGPGIPAEVKKRLFTPFFTTKPIGQGTGLGLSICQRIITNLGGEISLESEMGVGTTVRIVLPAAVLDAPAAAPATAATARKASRRGRILVIDDEPLVALAVRRTLQGEHDVTTSPSATEARRLIESGLNFDVILCDLMMPQVTGMDFFEMLSGHAPAQAERVIFLTGGAFTPRARNFLDQTPNQRLEKPFDPPNLRAIVNDRVR